MSRSEIIRIPKDLKARLDRMKPVIFGDNDEKKSYADVIYYLVEHSLGTKLVFLNKFEDLIKTAKLLEEGGDPEHPYLLHIFRTCYDKSGKSKKATRELNASLLEWLTGKKIDISDEDEVRPEQPPTSSTPGKQPQTFEANKDDGNKN
jgi:hypothetical protein